MQPEPASPRDVSPTVREQSLTVTPPPMRVAPSRPATGSQTAPPAAATPPPWPGDPAWDLERLWYHGSKPRQWIVEPLIAVGDQVVLAGEPKSGKSLLASQLCLEISKGSGPLKINVPDVTPPPDKPNLPLPLGYFETRRKKENGKKLPWVVLYVSFEMGPQIMWARAAQQANGLKLSLFDPKMPANTLRDKDYRRGTYTPNIPYHHLFSIRGGRTLGIVPAYKPISLEREQENAALRSEWEALLDALKPDLIVLDSLSQLHFCDENSNLEMRDALQQLRRLCTVQVPSSKRRRPVAHIIIHHTRKESGDQKYSRKDASEMRGASSIHAEADLAITITKRVSNGDEISLSFSSRHSSRLPDLRLRRHQLNAIYSGVVPPEPTALTISRQLYRVMDGRDLRIDEIMEHYRKTYKKKPDDMLGRSSWDKLVKKLADLGALIPDGTGVRGKPAKFRVRKAIKEADWVKLVEAAFSASKSDSRKPRKSA